MNTRIEMNYSTATTALNARNTFPGCPLIAFSNTVSTWDLAKVESAPVDPGTGLADGYLMMIEMLDAGLYAIEGMTAQEANNAWEDAKEEDE